MTSFVQSSPSAHGVAAAGIADYLDALERAGIEMHSLMVLRHGEVLAQGWWSPFAPDRRHLMYSLSKSFTSMAAGIAWGEGAFDLDDLVVDVLPEVVPDELDDRFRGLRVRHVLSMASTRSRHREFKQLLEALRRAAGSAECDAEAVNFLKLGGAMRPEEPFDKIQNRFAKLEALVLTFLNSKRLTELCSALVDCRLLDPAQQALVCGVSRSTRSCLAARIVEEKLSLEGFVMCMVNRKFDEKQPKEYFSLLEAVLKDLEAKCSYMLRGALSQGDAEDLLAELRVAALRFALEVLQDMLTKVGFSNEGFERVQNDYPHIKRHLRLRESDDTRSEDLLHSRVCELKELIGDKNKLLAHICANCLLLSNLLMRKLSEKHLANSDLDQVKEAARKSIALLANN